MGQAHSDWQFHYHNAALSIVETKEGCACVGQVQGGNIKIFFCIHAVQSTLVHKCKIIMHGKVQFEIYDIGHENRIKIAC